jgi:hypothetical protein
MICDPSDGSVREKSVVRKSRTTEKPVDQKPVLGPSAKENDSVSNYLVSSTTSGLPIMGDQKEIERLSKSREWLGAGNEEDSDVV